MGNSQKQNEIFASGYSLAVLATKVFGDFQGKDWIGMDKRKTRISAVNLLANELPDVKVMLEEKNTIYTFKGVYDGSRAMSAKLLRLMENDENDMKGANK